MAQYRIYLDTRRADNQGRHKLLLILRSGESMRRMNLNINLRKEEWDGTNVTHLHPMYKRINISLNQIRAQVETVMLRSRNMELDELKQEVASVLFIKVSAPKKKRGTLLAAVEQYAHRKQEPNTRATYERTAAHIRAFRPFATFEDVNREWLEDFDAHMAQTSGSPNARAIHMRNLRAVFNFAIDNDVTQNYPFRKYKIRTIATAKRSMSAEELRKVLTIEVEEWQRPYRDFFALSFYLIGMNAKDLLTLRHDALRGDRLVYNRSKTKKLYQIRVEPEALALIERYKGKEHLLNFMDGRTDYLQYIRQCNHALQLIGTHGENGKKRTGEAYWPGLTTYWARHSWATIAARLDVPKETIAAALGHGQRTVTDIYIDFDVSKIDEANRRVLDAVLK